MDLITFTVLQNTNFHFIFALRESSRIHCAADRTDRIVSGRMYTNTLLAVSTARIHLISRLTRERTDAKLS
jgi:hypothetical protein